MTLSLTGEHDEYYEVWVQNYNTFGEGDRYVSERYYSREVAERAAELLNAGWGNRAWVEKIDELKIEDITVEQLDERYEWLIGMYPELKKKRPTKTQRRVARKGK